MSKLELLLKSWGETLYLIYFGFAVFFYFLTTTMIPHGWVFDLHIYLGYGLLGVICVLAKSIAERETWTKKDIVLTVLFGGSLLMFQFKVGPINGIYNALQLVVLWVGAHHVRFSKIAKVYLGVVGSTILMGMILSALGYAQYLTFVGGKDELRHAFGSIYPTDFATGLVYCKLACLWLKRKKIQLFDLGSTIVLIWFVVTYCIAKTSTLCLIMIAIIECVFYFFQNHSISMPKWVSKILCLVYPMTSLTMIFLSYFYDSNSALFAKLDRLFTYRISLSKIGFTRYSIPLFGQRIQMVGLGGGGNATDYFFLDSSYINILLGAGILVFVALLIVVLVAQHKAYINHDVMFLCIMVVLSFHSLMEQHFMEVAYNIFLLYAIAQRKERYEDNFITDTTVV